MSREEKNAHNDMRNQLRQNDSLGDQNEHYK